MLLSSMNCSTLDETGIIIRSIEASVTQVLFIYSHTFIFPSLVLTPPTL